MVTTEGAFDRTTGIGGSDIAAILGVSPYATITDVWMEKTKHPAWRPKAQTPEMRWGNLLEPVMREEYEVETGRRVFAPGDKTYISDDGIRYAHLDGLVEGEGIWEGKVPFNTWRNWQDGAPVYVQAQVQHYMDLTGEPWCDVSALLPGASFQTFRVQADPETQAHIRIAATRFWHHHVLTGEPPEPLGILIEYPTHKSDLLLVADDEAERLVAQLREARANQSGQGLIEEQLKEQLQRMIGTAAGMTGDGWRIRFKKNRDSEKIAWQHVATAYRKQLDDLALVLERSNGAEPLEAIEDALRLLTDAPSADTLIRLYTTVQPGARPFVLEWTKED